MGVILFGSKLRSKQFVANHRRNNGDDDDDDDDDAIKNEPTTSCGNVESSIPVIITYGLFAACNCG